jgi:hypothetical protein
VSNMPSIFPHNSLSVHVSRSSKNSAANSSSTFSASLMRWPRREPNAKRSR